MTFLLACLSTWFLQVDSNSAYYAAMRHRHLVLAYVLTWAVQLGYLAWVLWKWRKARD